MGKKKLVETFVKIIIYKCFEFLKKHLVEKQKIDQYLTRLLIMQKKIM
jgi:hypothetical protein